jgi:hypothetical protein
MHDLMTQGGCPLSLLVDVSGLGIHLPHAGFCGMGENSVGLMLEK